MMARGETHTGIFTADAGAYLGRAPEVSVEEVAEGLWSAAAGDYRVAFAEGAEGVVAFNTLDTPGAARALREAIEATLPGKPIRTLVQTIDHLDHTGYGEELAPGAEVHGHELTARMIAGRGASGQSAIDRPLAGAGEARTLDGVAVELRYPGPTQGSGNLAVHFPERRVLFLVGPRADARYGLFADVHFSHYARAVRSLLDLEFDVVVPGRGALMDRAGLERSLEYVETMQLVTQEAFAQGLPVWIMPVLEGYAKGRLADRFGDLEGFDDHVGIGAIRVVHHYLMGGWGLEDTHEPERILAG
jgi:hypothetical protein